jgi:hypothetical protein
LATERITALRHSLLACILLFWLGIDVAAEDIQAILPIEGPLQCGDREDNSVMFLIIEVTIPSLFANTLVQNRI